MAGLTLKTCGKNRVCWWAGGCVDPGATTRTSGKRLEQQEGFNSSPSEQLGVTMKRSRVSTLVLVLVLSACGGSENSADTTRTKNAALSDQGCMRRDLSGVVNSNSDYSFKYFACADMTGSNLRESNFEGAFLTDANLYGANLTSAFLYRANLTAANLAAASLTGARVAGAILPSGFDCGASGAIGCP